MARLIRFESIEALQDYLRRLQRRRDAMIGIAVLAGVCVLALALVAVVGGAP